MGDPVSCLQGKWHIDLVSNPGLEDGVSILHNTSPIRLPRKNLLWNRIVKSETIGWLCFVTHDVDVQEVPLLAAGFI